ncbi:hypothetical protein SEA_SOUL22_61 [Mycobacterium phage Soul22]|uniref:Uncharacterized protein n=3 Tax=Gracegardnervirinae TaxID=2946632 RepID=Q855F0_9CAUD|nr:hypothetical protein PBI_CHE8_60 [Mycobacterium phage Che8]YP_009956507.1 hypothetical protein I5H32_gp056 [Mycobacterium phage EleanorGeorge]YP_009963876.1 hypothetical protein I5I03_gp061 [Mycobacterium phage Soul22]AAN12458.1 hypothetical protein PBI_CHE8_60 [Mycobacterium phage Che8]AXQ60756.1 hypothetical protein SEA_ELEANORGEORGE_56 [Mycobacterium phage EleanorGeorge]QLF84280.1 hypothetical protein SEA_SOUL22_61 [Mycobacterium phage Soul22]
MNATDVVEWGLAGFLVITLILLVAAMATLFISIWR